MRVWEKELIEAGSPQKKKFLAYVIRCGSPGCYEMAVGGGNIGRFSAHDALPKIFGQKGWTVGSKEKHDRCPACTRKHADGRRALEEKVVPMSPRPPVGFIQEMDNSRQNKKAETHVHHVIPPEPMSKQDRRVIFAKLQDVYIDEQVGYGAGWDDEKVAVDLGVPRAWVAEVREENFGPEKSEQVAKLLEDGHKLMAEVMQEYNRSRGLADQLKDALAALTKAMLRLDKFDKDLKELAKRAGK